MRTTFIEELIILARSNPRIFLVVGDLGFSVVEPFAKEFPERYLNAGISEQNMAGLAAGLASEGYHVFVYSIANFPTFRCAEQIRNDIAYHKLPVTIVAVGGGLAYGSLGYSHHAVQDLALMRTLPNMLIAAPGDPEETRACLRYLHEHPQPSYLRLGKAGEPRVHTGPVFAVPGAVLCSKSGPGQVVLLSTAATLKLAHEVSSSCQGEEAVSVYSLPLWNADCSQQLVEFVAAHRTVITLEDHLRSGGFGSFVQESLDGHPELLPRVRCIALDASVCGHVGSQAKLNEMGGLSVGRIRLALGIGESL